MTSRSRVTVLAGFAPAATDAVARSLLVADPSLTLVGHDLSAVRDGVVTRTVRTAAGVIERGRTELVHGCVSCTLREDVLPTLERLSRERPGSDIVLCLPPAIEPAAVAALPAELTFDSFVTVVEAAGLLDDLTSSDDLRDRDLHAAANDRRGVAEVVARQIEYADTIVVWGSPALGPYDRDQAAALLHRLTPWAVQVRVGDGPTVDCTGLAARLLRTGRHDPAVPAMLGRALEGYPIGIHDRAGDHGVNAMLFQSRRPFHPQRLHDALEDLAATSLRGRGQLWIATQPDTAIAWESAGGNLMLGNLGLWLAALPADRWDEATPMRRLSADAAWDPYYGDRGTALSFVGLGLDTDALTATLKGCLLADAELAEGADAWSKLPDPFAEHYSWA
ncbi:GTP-binding protein [Actinoplanes sp. Pm04-4]|uniref:GTP-binding protein n=1 Tax=Paractinoplanes pyxinae TaxID=2997416 RepID=A0ABT4BIR4_9ACTN|nr:GTP-binding protein [Actinoplanes pyxinae]MCY1145483.1 GTP-binding protein [Actinoplanes pyxinae]